MNKVNVWLAEVGFFEKVINEVKSSFTQMSMDVVNTFPDVIAGIVILIVGYLIASILQKGIGTTLTKINFDKILDKAGVGSVFQKIGVKGSPSILLSKVVFYVVLLFVIKSVAAKIGLVDVSEMIETIFAFLPKAFISVLILLFGFVVAEMVQNASRVALEALNLDYAKALSNVLFGFVFVIILTVALDQLGIQTELLNASVMIILGALGIAMALALGMGLRNLAKAIVSGVYARDVYQPGTEIEIDGELARVAGVGPVTTKLQTKDGGFLMIPNAELIELRVKGQSAE